MLHKELRKVFLNFFSGKGHVVLPSSSLIPHGDPSLLFTNAGMVQFKDKFTGKEKGQFANMVTAQKCIRAGGKHNDLDNVGHNSRHHTFFEMLGNFSFGGFFKEEAIRYAWEFLTQEIKLDKQKLYVTVYYWDCESYLLWKKISGLQDGRIIKIKTKDNFWSMGAEGPCGPSTEIFYDHGEQFSGGLPGTKEQDGDRYVEIWNIVFMQYEKLSSGVQVPLPIKCIDTGMGLERVLAILQGVNSNYDTDIFRSIIKASQLLSQNTTNVVAHKVIADHLRSICFILADGIMPSNEGRGYVLRRIMRRAMRYIHNMSSKKNILQDLASIFIELMSDSFDELVRAKDFIVKNIAQEEDKFATTLNIGMKFLDNAVTTVSPGKILAGETAFNLYDTYGFPLDLTVDILKEKGMTVDVIGFNKATKEQKEKAKSSWIGNVYKEDRQVWYNIYKQHGATEFVANNKGEISARVIAIIKDGKQVVECCRNEEVVVVTDKTVFYAESGGQIGDRGYMSGKGKVFDTKLYIDKIFAHVVQTSSFLKEGDELILQIDSSIRKAITANHSATHLLHHVLRSMLGYHVMQKGSLVTEEKLRFDFSHAKALSDVEIVTLEEKVNELIYSNKETFIKTMSIKRAKEKGVMALFGEKYDDNVRVVTMGDSEELCGGTHVKRTGEIGYFCITGQESIAAGIRRIEACTMSKAVQYARAKIKATASIANLIKCSQENIVIDTIKLKEDYKRVQKERDIASTALLLTGIQTSKIKHFELKTCTLKEQSIALKTIFSELSRNNKNFVAVLVNIDRNRGKTSIFIGISKDLAKEYQANKLLLSCRDIISGKGGGNKYMAQASGDNIHETEKIFSNIESILRTEQVPCNSR